jgi:hypothetical protein
MSLRLLASSATDIDTPSGTDGTKNKPWIKSTLATASLISRAAAGVIPAVFTTTTVTKPVDWSAGTSDEANKGRGLPHPACSKSQRAAVLSHDAIPHAIFVRLALVMGIRT